MKKQSIWVFQWRKSVHYWWSYISFSPECNELTSMLDPLSYRWGVPPVVIRCVHWTMQMWALQTWIKALGLYIVMGQNHAIQLKLPGALFCLLSARMLLRVLLCRWVLILWIQKSSPWVVGGPCAKPYVLLPGWGGLWAMPVVLFLSVWRVSCPLWSWRKQRWSWYSRYNVGIF